MASSSDVTLATSDSSSGNPPVPDCPICAFKAVDMRKLKTHLLLKHPNLNLCLFCVEKKGWSDVFASQSQYNQHFSSFHRGAIIDRCKSDQDKVNDTKRKLPNPEKPTSEVHKVRKSSRGSIFVCLLCPSKPVFDTGLLYERHQITDHDFDYCKLCNLIGPSRTVRYHILDEHYPTLCSFCCSQSPVFQSKKSLQSHLISRHSIDKMTCYDCDRTKCMTSSEQPQCTFESRNDLMSHIFEHHIAPGDVLRPMRKKRMKKDLSTAEDNSDEMPINDANAVGANDDESKVRNIVGIKNESGQHCFVTAVLHLIARTDIVADLKVPRGHSKCTHASCLLARFTDQYKNFNRKAISPSEIIENLESFDILELPVDVGDFLRGILGNISKNLPEHGGNADIKSLVQLSLQWKFECSSCRRYMVTLLSDNVLRISGCDPGSLNELLEKFLFKKKCTCGTENSVQPVIKNSGKYIFLEIDRASDCGNDSKEIVLYSLRLEQTYNLFGFRYRLFGAISYNLELEDGGHFLTNIFHRDVPTDCIKIHESEVKNVRRRPDFDSDIVIVALVRQENTAEEK